MKGKFDAYKQLICVTQRVHFQVWIGVFSCQDKYLFGFLWYCDKKQVECGLAWSVLLSTTIRVIMFKMLWTHKAQPSESIKNWATSQSTRFALVIEYVSSIHPWANRRCWINQSESALCFSYVTNWGWRIITHCWKDKDFTFENMFHGQSRVLCTCSTISFGHIMQWSLAVFSKLWDFNQWIWLMPTQTGSIWAHFPSDIIHLEGIRWLD